MSSPPVGDNVMDSSVLDDVVDNIDVVLVVLLRSLLLLLLPVLLFMFNIIILCKRANSVDVEWNSSDCSPVLFDKSSSLLSYSDDDSSSEESLFVSSSKPVKWKIVRPSIEGSSCC